VERQFRDAAKPITASSRMPEDLKADLRQLSRLRSTLMTRLRVHFSGDVIREAKTVGDVIQYAADMLAKREEVQRQKEARKAAEAKPKTPPISTGNWPNPPWPGASGGVRP